MGALPAVAAFAYATNPDWGTLAGNLELVTAFIRQNLSGAARGALVISAGACTPTVAAFTVDTEAAAATDDLDTISQTNFPTGSIILVSSLDASKVVTLTQAGNLILRDGKSIVLYDPADFVVFVRVAAVWWEVFRSHQNRLSRVRALTAATTLVASDSGCIITNTGAVADRAHVLPAATVGMSLRVRVTAAFKIKLTASGSDTITDDDGTTVGAAGGNTEIAAVVGNAFEIECFEAAKWVVRSARGTLTTA